MSSGNEAGNEPKRSASRGLFITRGSRVAVPRFNLRMADDGTLESDIALHVSVDLCPYWLTIANSHVLAVEASHAEVLAAWSTTDDARRAAALEAEFADGMQAAMAAAIAVDAFYARVKEEVALPEGTVEKWRENGTARYKQITEVLRRGFRVSPRAAVQLRLALKELFMFRDWAVHPPAEARAPLFYEELGVHTEWRFVVFRYENARNLCGRALSIVAQLLSRPRDTMPQLVKHCGPAAERVRPLLDEWEARYGQLYVRPAPDPPTA